jgi:Carboxypeptidase regulatory-like domain
VRPVLLAACCMLLLPALAHAQATLAGTIRDSSGAVLPGVSVEAASAALIEKSRTAVTDTTGQYRITELPPGEYAITFSLSGFSTVKHEGVTVSGSGVIPINAEMRVGAIAETVTVTGAAPLVDTQSTRREVVVNSDTINSMPITRSYGGVLYAVPGLSVAPGVGGNDNTPSMSVFTAHGGNSTEGRMMVNGVPVAGSFSGNSVAQFGYDVANADELQVLVSGGLGESETGGPLANLLPKSGGNVFKGSAFYSGTTSKLQANNIDDALVNAGIPQPPAIRQNWDGSGSLGGPIRRDKVWFFGNVRTFGLSQVVEGAAPNLYVGDAAKWLYAPQTGVEVRRPESKLDTSIRLTGQVTPRNRVSFSHQRQDRCFGSSLTVNGSACRIRTSEWIGMGSATTTAEAGPGYSNDPSSLTQATWTSTVSNRLLIDAAVSRFSYGIVGSGQVPDDAVMDLVGVTERSAIYGRAGFTYRAPFTFSKYDNVPWNWRAAASYVTGAHSVKIGYQGAYMKYDRRTFVNNTQLRYIFNNQVPIGVNYYVAPYFDFGDRTETNALYAQDQWTLGRITVQGAVRYDHVTSWAPADKNGVDSTSRFNRQPIKFDTTTSVSGYNDINPRLGAAINVFGNGKTALKMNVGKYLAAATADGIYSANSPALKLVTQLSGTNGRGWTDTNSNYQVDCDLLNPSAQSPTTTGSADVCAALTGANLNFGNVDPSLTVIDPAILSGWGVRPYNWQFGTSIQHELLPRVSVELGYNRRWWGNFFTTVNTLVNASDYDIWTVPVPSNANLSSAGSAASFAAITAAASARGSRTLQTKETNFAPARTAYWHGMDYTATARLGRGLTVQGGGSTGRGVRDTCALWQARPELAVSGSTAQRLDACAVTEPWLTSVRGLASYRLPKVDVLLSATLRSTRTNASGDVASNGSALAANYQLPNTVVQQYLGRLPAGQLATGTTTVNLLPAASLYPLERQTQVDMRFAKTLKLGRTRYDVGVDLYNLLNANAATAYDQSYLYSDNGATWLRPTSITSPRLARFNVTMNF